MNRQNSDFELQDPFGDEDDTILDEPMLPQTKSRYQGRGGARKSRVSIKSTGLQRGQLPICNYVVQRSNQTESNRPPGFCNRPNQPPILTPLGSVQNVAVGHGGHHIARIRGTQGYSRVLGSGSSMQSKYSSYQINRGSTSRYGSESASRGYSNQIQSKSPYFTAQARHTPVSFHSSDFDESQKEDLEPKFHARKSYRAEAKPLIHAQGVYIKQVREWIRHKDVIEMLMDVYGYVDSEIVTKEYGRKEFLLRDETGNIYVSYYEIDTPMLYVPRRTWLKVSCVWRSWGLQAVAVHIPEEGFIDNLETKAHNSHKMLQDKLRQHDNPTF